MPVVNHFPKFDFPDANELDNSRPLSNIQQDSLQLSKRDCNKGQMGLLRVFFGLLKSNSRPMRVDIYFNLSTPVLCLSYDPSPFALTLKIIRKMTPLSLYKNALENEKK